MTLPALLLLILAPAIGSFLALLVDRLPRGEDVILSRSRCRDCGTALRPPDLVPLLSWPMLRGRCRHCRAAIPVETWGMELGALLLAVLALWVSGDPWQAVTTALVLWLLLALAVCDLRWMLLPDALTAALLASALGLAWAQHLLPEALIGAVAGAGSFWLIRIAYAVLRRREGLGLGDVKLMAGIGALTGVYHLPLLVLVAAGGALLVVSLLQVAWPLARGMRPALDAQGALPFGTALCGAMMLLWLLGKTHFHL